MKKVLILGSKGFIGKELVPLVEDCDYIVYEYDLVDGNDIRDKFKLDNLFNKEKFNYVINLAARSGVPMGEEHCREYFDTNVLGLKTLMEVAQKHGVEQFIHFSSSAVFATSADKQSEIAEKKPTSVYGITKLAGEQLLESSDLPYVIVRPFTVIGITGRKEMVLLKWTMQTRKHEPVTFYGDGTSSRGYTYVGDLILGVVDILGSDIKREDINLGGDQEITLNELWDIFRAEYPGATREMLEMQDYDKKNSIADTKKAKKLLNWKPRGDIKKHIQTIITIPF